MQVSYIARAMLDALLHSSDVRRARSSTVTARTQRQVMAPSRSCMPLCCGARAGNYLVISYMVVKLVLLANAAAHVYLIQRFTDTNYT